MRTALMHQVNAQSVREAAWFLQSLPKGTLDFEPIAQRQEVSDEVRKLIALAFEEAQE